MIFHFSISSTAKVFAKDVFINQERKVGVRRRSDTVLIIIAIYHVLVNIANSA